MTCEDCGKFVVADKGFISAFSIDDDTFYGVSRCAYCDRIIFQSASKELIGRFFALGVKVFSWRTGEEMESLNA